MNTENEIVIYQPDNSEIRVEVQTDGDTVWLNRQQISILFARDIKTIGKHINNALNDELAGYPVVAKFATTAADGKIYQTEHYNLDVVISVGYRVKSPEGIRFRRWATTVLKQHLLKGYTINESRLKQLHQVLNIISRSAIPEIAGISEVLGFFSNGLDLLDEYDHQTLKKPEKKVAKATSDWILTYEETRKFVDSMKFNTDSDLFGREKDELLKSALGAIYQTFGGQEVYPTIQEKAANLLYLVVKNHAFFDGNKRIAAALFAYFLEKHGILFDENRQPIIENSTLAAITLMIALSRPEEKDTMCLLVMNILTMK